MSTAATKPKRAIRPGLRPARGTNPERLPVPRAPLLDAFRRGRIMCPELCYITSHAVGHAVNVYWGGPELFGRRGGKAVYQVMRDHEGPGPGEEFWEHQLWERPQWYETPEEACAAYVASHREWLARAQRSEEG